MVLEMPALFPSAKGPLMLSPCTLHGALAGMPSREPQGKTQQLSCAGDQGSCPESPGLSRPSLQNSRLTTLPRCSN